MMDKQSSEIIENFIGFLRSKKEVISKYNKKYSNDDSEEVTLKRYEFDDIISELNDSISQSIQAIKSLQMENENLKETIWSIQTLQQSNHLKQSAFSFENKNHKPLNNNYEYCEKNHLDNSEENNEYYVEELNQRRILEAKDSSDKSENKFRITNESEITIGNKDKSNLKRKDLLEEEEIMPQTQYELAKNSTYDFSHNDISDRQNDEKVSSKYKEEFNITSKSKQSNSPRFTSKRIKELVMPEVHKQKEMKENMLIVDSYSINKNENTNIALNINKEEGHYQEEFYKNFQDNSKASPLKVGIRQKLKNHSNNISQNSCRIKSNNQSLCQNPNSRSQTLNISNVYSNQADKEYEGNSMIYPSSNSKINKDDRELLLSEIIEKLTSKENFKNYFTHKYSEGSFIELQNRLFTSESFLYEIGRELYEIEDQISNFQVAQEESKYCSSNNINNTTSNILNRNSLNTKQKEDFSKTSHNFPLKERSDLRANSNKHSNLKRVNNENKYNENNYFEPINFEKLLRNERRQPINNYLIKKPFNRFIKPVNPSIDKKRTNNLSSNNMNRSKSRDIAENKLND